MNQRQILCRLSDKKFAARAQNSTKLKFKKVAQSGDTESVSRMGDISNLGYVSQLSYSAILLMFCDIKSIYPPRGCPPHLRCSPLVLLYWIELKLCTNIITSFGNRCAKRLADGSKLRETQWFKLIYQKNARKCDGELKTPTVWWCFKKKQIYFSMWFLYGSMQI